MIVEFEAHNVARGFMYTLYPRRWQMRVSKEQALSLISELQNALIKLDIGEEDE